jgi:hypothetical protein
MVLSVPERQSGEPYPQVTAAVRALTDDYGCGLRFVVDGSSNSIPPELLATIRETVISVEPMLKEEIESIPKIKGLIDFIKRYNLDGPVWNMLGGSPARYLKLKEVANANMLLLSNTSSDEAVGEVKKHLQSILSDALNNNVFNSSSNTEKIIKMFRDRNIIKISKAELRENGFSLYYSNNMFRDVKVGGRWFVELSSPAVS